MTAELATPGADPDGGASRPMDPGSPEVRAIIARLRRAQGQLGGVVGLLEQGGGCREVVTQLAAAKRALDRAGFVLFQTALQECLTDPDTSPEDAKAVQRLFLTLS